MNTTSRSFDAVVTALVIGKTVSSKSLFRIELNDNFMATGFACGILTGVCKSHLMDCLVGKNILISNRQPDGPNDTWQVFFVLGGKYAPARYFR